MRRVNRRAWMTGIGAAAVAASAPPGIAGDEVGGASGGQAPAKAPPLLLTDFQPRSMLHVTETTVEKPRFPVVDAHTHLSFSRRDGGTRYTATPEELLAVMDRRGVRTMINLTGGSGDWLAETIRRYDRAHPGRFVTFTEPSWSRASESGYAAWQAEELARSRKAGARGVKVLKTLGLYLRDGGPTGKLVAIDDRALRSDVGGVRPAGSAGGDPHRRSGGLLPADRSVQRTVRGAGESPGLGVQHAGLSRAIATCWPPAIACSRGTPRRRFSRFTSAMSPRTWRSSASGSTATRTCASSSARASASWAASRGPRGGSSRVPGSHPVRD